MNAQASPFTAYRRHLPHRHYPNSVLFLTWRLGDSLPKAVVERTKRKRELWLSLHPKPWPPEVTRTYHRLFTQNINRWLDRGVGACELRTPENARIMADALHYFNRVRYRLYCSVIMPNHVHALLQLEPGWSLAKISQSLKGYTARRINQRENRHGSLWQQEVWDRIVRSPAQFQKYRDYILKNPIKAHLNEDEYLLIDTGTRPDPTFWG
ncbi:MAG: transposase [Kiritimatiellae bacterium]|jgi:putative transposase|nr:transposase [Kiritimatiellia bacterium]